MSANVTPRQITPVSTSVRPRLNAPRKSSRLVEMATRQPSSTAARSSLFAEPERPHTRATHSSRNRAKFVNQSVKLLNFVVFSAALNSDTENSGSMSSRTRSGATTSARGTSSGQRVLVISEFVCWCHKSFRRTQSARLQESPTQARTRSHRRENVTINKYWYLETPI